MESQNQFEELDDRAYTESFDDVMTICPRPGMMAQERYEFRKNNKPTKNKPSIEYEHLLKIAQVEFSRELRRMILMALILICSEAVKSETSKFNLALMRILETNKRQVEEK
jgi:hypothetical protein